MAFLLTTASLSACQSTPDNTRCPEGVLCIENADLKSCNADSDCTPNICSTEGALNGYCDNGQLSDLDHDNIFDRYDNCTGCGNPDDCANTDQANHDTDELGDVCDLDDDDDGTPDTTDNCPIIENSNQLNTDGDDDGNVCDTNDDNDSILDVNDNCPLLANTNQLNTDLDILGDVCDTDDDNDLISDGNDNCSLISNHDQVNTDGDAFGDPCDTDIDGDEDLNGEDNCPLVINADQADVDNDLLGDLCDTDIDGDGIVNASDNCPSLSNFDQKNFDNDLLGDTCDDDDDADSVLDTSDNCLLVTNPNQGLTDCLDTDFDGIKNVLDNCSIQSNTLQADTDSDGIGDACDIKKVTAGAYHTCALLFDGRVKCWGWNAYGQLGLGDALPRGTTAKTMGLGLPFVNIGAPVRDIAAGSFNTCVILDDYKVKCWGRGEYGELAQSVGTYGDDYNEPIAQLPTLEFRGSPSEQTTSNIALGSVAACVAVNTISGVNTGKSGVTCWGYAGNGTMGRENTNNVLAPIVVPSSIVLSPPSIAQGGISLNSTSVTDLDLGFRHVCAITGPSAIICWGYNSWGQLGNGNVNSIGHTPNNMPQQLVPVSMTSPTVVKTSQTDRQDSDHAFSCAIYDNGKLKCWGNNDWGQLGANNTTEQHTASNPPVILSSSVNTTVLSIALGGRHTCAIFTESGIATRKMKCWGWNDNSQVGLLTNTSKYYGSSNTDTVALAPEINLSSNTSIEPEQITAGRLHTCVLRSDSNIKCWGYNGNAVEPTSAAAGQIGRESSSFVIGRFLGDPVVDLGLHAWTGVTVPD